jgi:hypothetical protein
VSKQGRQKNPGRGPMRGSPQDKARTGYQTQAKVRRVHLFVDAVDAGIECECGGRFHLALPLPTFADKPAETGDWVVGACPDCKRAHRARPTLVVNVEEEMVPNG